MSDTILDTPISTDELREELFPEESEDNLLPASTTMDVTRMISHIRLIEKQIEQYTSQDQESRRFYQQRKERCDERIGMIKSSILAFLQQSQLRNIQTPAGTAFQKTITRKEWPEDQSLLAWVKEHLPGAVRVKEEPDKPTIADHIKRTGEVPDGYSESTETRLYLR